MLDALKFPEDFHLVQKCLEGDPASIKHLQDTYRTPLTNYLVHRGATGDEARTLVDDLWADCLMERKERPPRLATYGGNSPLQAWLKAVVFNKFLQLKREYEPEPMPIEGDPPYPTPYSSEAPLLDIMAYAVTRAFKECDSEDFLLLHLAHTYELKGVELAPMFRCAPATISRRLDHVREKIKESTLRYVKARDRWLILQWEDFMELTGVVSPACFGIE